MPNKLKVLYASFDRVPAPKGASTHIAQFVRELANHHNVTLLTPGPAAWEGETFGARHHVIAVEGANFLRDTEVFSSAVSETLSRERFDVAHFRSIWEGIPIMERKIGMGYRAIYEVNGLPSVELQYHYPSVVKNTEIMERIRSMEMIALVGADAIIVPSKVTRNYLVNKGIVETKIRVIPNGVDTDLFKPPQFSETESGGPIKIIYVGTLAPWQGVSHLIEAFKRVTRVMASRNAPVLQIVGKARKDWLKELTKLARKLKIEERVEFAEAVRHREMPAVIGQAHIGAAPFLATERNTRQGFCPIKVLEYMACGLPVVAPDIPAVTELARHEMEALLYKPNSMARLADSLIQLIEDETLRRTLGKNGRKRAESFTWKIARSNFIELYEGIRQ